MTVIRLFMIFFVKVYDKRCQSLDVYTCHGRVVDYEVDKVRNTEDSK
jgi:hypothetical protein